MEKLEGWTQTAYVVVDPFVADRRYETDEVLQPFYGCTYGAIGPAGVAVVRPGTEEFMEVPRANLRIVGVD